MIKSIDSVTTQRKILRLRKETPTETLLRSLNVIFNEVDQSWTNPYFGAVPYIRALKSLDNLNDMFVNDKAVDLVRYFLSNAQTWKGVVARRIKKELKQMISSYEKNKCF